MALYEIGNQEAEIIRKLLQQVSVPPKDFDVITNCINALNKPKEQNGKTE